MRGAAVPPASPTPSPGLTGSSWSHWRGLPGHQLINTDPRLRAPCQDRPLVRQCPSPVATDGRLDGPSTAWRVGTVGSWCSSHGLAGSRGQGGWGWGGNLGTWAFGVLPVSSAALTSRREFGPIPPSPTDPGLSLSRDWYCSGKAGGFPTDWSCRPPTGASLEIWVQPTWLAVGRKVAGDSHKGTKLPTSHGRIDRGFCPPSSLIPGDLLCWGPFSLSRLLAP